MFHPWRVLLFAALAALVSFNLRAVAPTDFAMKLPIAVNAAAVGEKSATDLPVLVRLSESIDGFKYSDLASDGSDLAFGVDDGGVITVYPHEIDTWDPEGESLVWVKVPVLDKDTSFNAYYGNGASGGAMASATWSNYTGVWHFGEAKTLTTEQTAVWPTAQAAYANSTAAEGLESYLSNDSLSGEEGRFGKCFRTNNAGCKTGSFNNGGAWVNDAGTDSPLDRGDTFTISGWFKHPEEKYYYDHIFYKRSQGDNKTDKANTKKFTGGFAIELKAGPAATPPFDVRGGNATSKTGGKLNAYNAWSYLTFVFEGQKITVYENGAQEYTATGLAAVTNNDAPLGIGTRPDIAYSGCTGDANWCGWIDEVRLNPAAASADYVALEYAAMATDGFLAFGSVETMDEDNFVFGDPRVAWDGSGWTFSVEITKGVGMVKALAVDLGTGTEYELIAETAKSGAGELSGAVELPGAGLYSVVAVGKTRSGTISTKTGKANVYGGTVTVAWSGDTDEMTLTPGAFDVSVSEALSGDLLVGYVVGGSAVPGQTYKSLPGAVVIPKGERTAKILIEPLFCAEVSEDVDVQVNLAEGLNYIPASTEPASLAIVNAAVDPFVQYVSPDGNDDNAGYTPSMPRKTVQAAVARVIPMSEVGHCTVHVADGIYPFAANTTGTLYLTNSISIVGNEASCSSVVFTNETAKDCRLVWMDHPHACLSGITLTKGRTLQQEYGANVRIGATGGTVSNCVLTAGYVDNYHGRGANVYMTSEDALVTHCVITKGYINSSGGGGKGAAVHIVNGRLEHSLVAENYETTGGGKADVSAGVYIENGSIVNCTIAGNTGYTCGGLYVKGKTAAVKNCVIAGNVASIPGGDANAFVLASGVSASVFANCAVDAAAAPNDTCLAAPAATLLSNVGGGDYTLAAASPAKDAGGELEHCPACDLAGNDRVQGQAIDMGAYESDPNQLALSFGADKTAGILPCTITYTASVTGVPDGTAVTYEWDFDGDGNVDQTTTDPEIAYVYEVGRRFTVSVTATAGGKSITATKEDYIQTAPAVLYVDAGSIGAEIPYGNWDTAANNLYLALDAAVDGCEIVVRGNTYVLTQTVKVNKGVVISSETGDPGSVVLKSGNFTAMLVDSAAALVRGLTLSDANGNAQPGGLKFGVAGGSVSNCVIRNCKCSSWASTGGAASFTGPGLLTHSVISNCTATTFCGGGPKYILDIPSGRMENCLIVGNYSSGGLDDQGRNDQCGSLLLAGSSAIICNNTFVGNSITNRGLLCVNTGAQILNNAFADNLFAVVSEETVDATTDVGFNFGSAASDAAFVNCATDFGEPLNATCKVGTTETMFKNYAQGDYSPKAGGPLYNAGVTPSGWEKITDLAGKPRVVGRSVDIGCYEGKAAGFMIYVR